MTRFFYPDKGLVREVIEKEQRLLYGVMRGLAGCGKPGHCAVGALLFAAGVPNAWLVAFGHLRGSAVTRLPSSWVNKVTRMFGLSRYDLLNITASNDQALDIRRRQKAVLAVVDALSPHGRRLERLNKMPDMEPAQIADVLKRIERLEPVRYAKLTSDLV